MPKIGTAYIEVKPDLSGFSRELRRQLREQDAFVGQEGERHGSMFGEGFGRGMGRMMSRAAMWGGAIALLAEPAVALANQLTAAGVAAGGMGAALAQGLGVGVIAFKGFGDAVKEVSTLQKAQRGEIKLTDKELAKLNRTLSELGPNTRELAGAIAAQEGAWKNLKRSIQEIAFAGLGKEFTFLAQQTLPAVRSGLGQTAAVLNDVMRDLMRYFAGPAGGSKLNDLLGGQAIILGRLGDAVVPLTDAFMTLFRAALPYAYALADAVAKLSEKFASFIRQKEATGELDQWFSNGVATLKEFGGLLKDVVKLFGDLGRSTSGRDLIRAVRDILRSLVPVLKELNESGFFDAIANLAIAVMPLVFGFTQFLNLMLKLITPVTNFVAQSEAAQDAIKMAGFAFAGWKIATGIISGVSAAISGVRGAIALVTAALNSQAAAWLLNTIRLLAYRAAVLLVRAATLIWIGVQWLLNAAMMANPIGLIVLAVIILIGIIIALALWIKHLWDTNEGFRNFVTRAWEEIKNAFKKAWDWVAEHWPLLLAILLGPIGAAIAWIIQNWDKVTQAFKKAWEWLKANWPLLLAIITGPIGIAVYEITKHWDQIVSGARNAVNGIVNFFRGLPGMILGALGNLGNLLFGPGMAIIQGLINGIKSMIPNVREAAASAVQAIKNFLPHSPAKEGPLSGKGAPIYSGESISKQLAAGILAEEEAIARATAAVMPTFGYATTGDLPSALDTLEARAGAGPVDVRVFIGETELTDIVRVEVGRNENNLARRLMVRGVPV